MNDLNLARKWRPKTFEQIVGQDISVRMLKNSLYLNKYFPVYLFAGLRGCGKTSTARVFGAAVNCRNLAKFQEDPNSVYVPCLECDSCLAMINGAHPDFIEIDAASHTGVDNVRQIVDSSSYMPLMGNKKIYLIDEAHMLSKSAFNAFLKILEEPPASVLFILATTEIPKVPATVLSRCFQVVFSPIQDAPLRDHIKNICRNESVEIDEIAIDLLLAETDGSARDAINLLERVRFSGEKITEETLLHVLGKISTNDLCELFESILDKNPSHVLAKLQQINFENVSAQNLWDMLVQLCRALLWIKYGVNNFKSGFGQSMTELRVLAGKCSLNRLYAILQLMWTQEELFLRTNKKHAFLEMVLLQICEQTNIADLKDVIAAIQSRPSLPFVSTVSQLSKVERPIQVERVVQVQSRSESPISLSDESQDMQQSGNSAAGTVAPCSEWEEFLKSIAQINDLFLSSILSSATFIKFDKDKNVVHLKLSNNSKFFKDKIEDSRLLWLAPLSQVFKGCAGFVFIEGDSTFNQLQTKPVFRKPLVDDSPIQISKSQPVRVENNYKRNNFDWVNVQDKTKWPKANLLMSFFPGKISKNS